MAHVDDLTFLNAAQLLNSDLLYVGRPSDGADPDKRTDIEELISRIIGPTGPLPVDSGSFTPTIIGETTNPTPTYNGQAGYYVRIGQLVWFVIYIATSAISGGSGALRFGGLPYAGSAGHNPPLPARPQGVDFGSGQSPYCFVRAGTTELGLGFTRSGLAPVFPTVSAWANNASLGTSGVYLKN